MPTPQITVIFLLYNAEKTVRRLVGGILEQKHPDFNSQAEWLEVLFVNDASRDGTRVLLEQLLKEAGLPAHFRVDHHSQNMGLARSLNTAFSQVRTPFVLTCHCDCFFGEPEYVAQMLLHLQRRPTLAALTGQPFVDDTHLITFAEKLNLITNLMDLFPTASDLLKSELIPVGFAEGRCDAFRMEALQKVGLYSTRLRTAGEDQLLAASLRREGYEVMQAPSLRYELSVSDSQDTVLKLMRHQQLFGNVHPFILFGTRDTLQGVSGEGAGANRRKRLYLRALQLMSATAYPLIAGGVFASPKFLVPAVVLSVAIFAAKRLLFARHLRKVQLSLVERAGFWLCQPLLDIAYTWGLLQGLVRYAFTGRDSVVAGS
jgi:cellulose synthase/poly-beta-1,6-N-acetylglucosamine synthase-like glycosyltransferase